MSYSWKKKGTIEQVSIEEIMNLLQQCDLTPDFLISMTSEKLEIKEQVGEITGVEKLLELRAWNEKEELKIWRDTISGPCFYRVASDAEWKEETEGKILPEVQFLDIDNTKTKTDGTKTFVVSTGGGRYELPFGDAKSDNTQVVINNYVDFYEATGQAYFVDWRVAGFQMTGGANNG